MLKLIHPENENDIAIVDAGSEAEAIHRGRGLVAEAELAASGADDEPEVDAVPDEKAAVAKRKGRKKG